MMMGLPLWKNQNIMGVKSERSYEYGSQMTLGTWYTGLVPLKALNKGITVYI
jgi:hypothetical protein